MVLQRIVKRVSLFQRNRLTVTPITSCIMFLVRADQVDYAVTIV